uniref:Acetyl-coenzyme A carboxylase carboxyl transferase subunit beta, chloroplastic n=1 Tax=Duranta erecta TaxID=167917 RepID=A0A8A0WQY9_DURER|nr:acetyl-CoA carboxylase subunit beta [Duranta erecta]QSQ72404.1 acetyl-CoA carboxylase subunit beta [Duranta erecta]
MTRKPFDFKDIWENFTSGSGETFIAGCIENNLHFIYTCVVSDSSESGRSSIRTRAKSTDFTLGEGSNDPDPTEDQDWDVTGDQDPTEDRDLDPTEDRDLDATEDQDVTEDLDPTGDEDWDWDVTGDQDETEDLDLPEEEDWDWSVTEDQAAIEDEDWDLDATEDQDLDVTGDQDPTEDRDLDPTEDQNQDATEDQDLDATEDQNQDVTEGRDLDVTEDLDPTKDQDATEDLGGFQKYNHLWFQCENCYGLNYKKFLKKKMNICEHCKYHLKMSSSERIESLIDPGTWVPMDEDMISLDPVEFHPEEEPYINRIDSYQRKTGLTEAVQTGVGKLKGIRVAMGVMDFDFMGGSMGSVVGEKITRLIEYATNQPLPLIIVCASGGARMQEGSVSLMQMAKIASALFGYRSKKRSFYVSILTSPTTGGVTASFGMLGDLVIAEPNACIAFAGKRVIEETLKIPVPEGLQEAEHLFEKGLIDVIIPRFFFKTFLDELLKFHGF